MPSTPVPILQAEQLNRKLSDTAGVTDLSLHLHRGDVLGLLGLNGAGKTTTLRLLAGTLAPDSGNVTVAGYSLTEQPLEARQRLGFLPDQPPLHNDMRVRDYVMLCARLRRIPRDQVAHRTYDVLERCSLTDVSRKRIGLLSKGYRQRVGLAQAIVHNPDVLLLDEPSNGLDPNQMQGMRNVISSVGENNAVVFSTHLLNEAQAVCNRIAVVHQGRLIHEADVGTDISRLEEVFTGLVHEQPAVVET